MASKRTSSASSLSLLRSDILSLTDDKNNPFSESGKCYHQCEARLVVANEHFYVCMELLSKLSDYFRVLFTSDFKEKSEGQYEIYDESPHDMNVFLKALLPHPNVIRVTDFNLQTLMRLADKFQTKGLKQRLCDYIVINTSSRYCRNRRSSSETLEWLKWCVAYNMEDQAALACLSKVGTLPLEELQANKHKIGYRWYSELLERKLEEKTSRALHHL